MTVWLGSPKDTSRERGVALVMVVLVLSALAVIGAPFVVSMVLHDRSSKNFSGEVEARLAAESYRNHALAQLEQSHASVEWEAEKEELEEEREDGSTRRTGLLGGRGTSKSARSRRSSPREGTSGRRSLIGRDRGRGSADGDVRQLEASARGPSRASYDDEGEIDVSFPTSVELPASAPPDPNAEQEGSVSFRDPRGVTTSVEIVDEQGKIHLDTAPPNLIANVFGVSRLARALDRKDDVLYLEDATPFRGDDDTETIDGAVVIVDPGTGRPEVVTYSTKGTNQLGGLFRGAFFSLTTTDGHPAGSFVYDLKGWKVGFHRFWSPKIGGFQPKSLSRLRSVEAMREIAHWQVASLFLGRFRGGGLSKGLLDAAKLGGQKLADMGLDPAMLDGDVDRMGVRQIRDYQRATASLRKLRFDAKLLKRLESRRGPHMILELAARLRGAKRSEVKKVEREIEEALDEEASSRKKLDLDPRYAKRVLEHMSRVYLIAGLETILPEDLEYHRDAFTVNSRREASWSEPQSILGDVSAAGPKYSLTVPRASDFGPGTIVRIRRHDARDRAEFNVVESSGGAEDGRVELRYPLRSSYRAFAATVEACERHPVNANTASRKVLRAVFTGVRGRDKKSVVTPYEADQLALRVLDARPLRGHEDFYRLLEGASSAGVVDDEDVKPLFVNAVQPSSYFLLNSTTGLCYATADVYTVESRAILRSPAGKEIAQARFREIVDSCPAGLRQAGMISQVDFSDGVYLEDPQNTPRFPENNHQFRLRFPGRLSHLMQTRPLLLHREPRVFPGADLSSLRLFPAETPRNSLQRYTFQEVERFEDTYEGLELDRGEPYQVSISGGGGNAGRGAAGAGGSEGGAGGALGAVGEADLTTRPGGFEFWFRMKAYPTARSNEGYYKIVESGGQDPERNRMALLYDDGRGRVLFRIHDSSFPDPFLRRSEDGGSFYEIEAQRPLELDTWYHILIVWDGVYGGGAQLYIDGVPVGHDNISTELVSRIPATGNVASIQVRDASKFPAQGVVRVGAELFEYSGRSKSALRIRQRPRSNWKPLPVAGLTSGVDTSGFGGPGGTGGAGGAVGSGPTVAAPFANLSVREYNGRGSAPQSHEPGEMVSVHGYSLEIRRKIRPAPSATGAQAREQQIADGDARTPVWSTGGLALVEPLQAWNFPTSVQPGIVHYFDRTAAEDEDEIPGRPGSGGVPRGPTGGGAQDAPGGNPASDGEGDGQQIPDSGDLVIPFFKLAGASNNVSLPGGGSVPLPGGGAVPGGAEAPEYTGMLQDFPRSSSDYFQSRGVCFFNGQSYRYQREPIPPEFLQILEADKKVLQPPKFALRLLGPYPSQVQGVQGLTAGGDVGNQPAAYNGREQRPVLQLSMLTNGNPQGRMPPTGVVEIRGTPTPWEAQSGRPNALSGPMMGRHPDDTVEWLRYVTLEPNMLVGRLRSNSNFRGYPVSERNNYLKKQLDHPAGQPIRLVLELSEGGAGWGDYVTITTNDPNVYEPGLRQVYKTLEHEDGRFYVSLVDVDQNGKELSVSRGVYRHNYTRSMNPRLVKFPTWGLPQTGSGSLTLFGDGAAVQVSGRNPRGGRSSRRSGGSRTSRGDDDSTGITIDEVRRFQNPNVAYDPVFKTRGRHVLVPLVGGRVRVDGGAQRASVGGAIPMGQSISRSKPLDIQVVTLSTQRGAPTLFAQGEDEGVLRIGAELFYWEAVEGSGQAGRATRAPRNQGAQNTAGYNPGLQGEARALVAPFRERLGEDRMSYQNVPTSGIQGYFEPQGFAMIADGDPERAGFFEVFYYGSRGAGFTNCLRGQFNTPYLESSDNAASQIFNVTRRIRLIARSLLGTDAHTHGVGEPVSHVPYLTMSPITGPINERGIPVKRPGDFAQNGGYVMIDPGVGQQPREIIAHLGSLQGGQLMLARDQFGKPCLRGRFGTRPREVGPDMIAYQMPFRYYDRYEVEVESESLAFLQRTFRVRGAHWRAIEWRERAHRLGKDRLIDVIVVGRFDGEPDWDVVPDEDGSSGLYLFEGKGRKRSEDLPRFQLERTADEFEIRVYFRYKSGAYLRVQKDLYRDDWKMTPILESLVVEYEKDGAILRHEELPH